MWSICEENRGQLAGIQSLPPTTHTVPRMALRIPGLRTRLSHLTGPVKSHSLGEHERLLLCCVLPPYTHTLSLPLLSHPQVSLQAFALRWPWEPGAVRTQRANLLSDPHPHDHSCRRKAVGSGAPMSDCRKECDGVIKLPRVPRPQCCSWLAFCREKAQNSWLKENKSRPLGTLCLPLPPLLQKVNS